VIGTQEQFEEAVNRVIKTVSFHQNNKVQVFELNIRALGGLVSFLFLFRKYIYIYTKYLV
jgi:mannosidase alpha-like ER degradation enhancer 1